jgi:hypothetical protein
MELNFDTYWEKLIGKVYVSNTGVLNQNYLNELSPNDLIFYQLTCIRGETMVDGVEAYFERRFDEFESDMNLLKTVGFQDLAEKYFQVKKIMFGENEMKKEFIENFFDKYYSLLCEDENYRAGWENEIDKLSLEIMDIIMERFDDYRMEFGIENELFKR